MLNSSETPPKDSWTPRIESGQPRNPIDRSPKISPRVKNLESGMESDTQRRLVVLKLLCTLALALQTLLCIMLIVLPVIMSHTLPISLTSVTSVITAVGYWLVYHNIQPTRYNICSRGLIGLGITFIAVLYLQSFTSSTGWPMLIGFIVPITLAGALLQPREALAITLGCTAFALVLHILQVVESNGDVTFSSFIGTAFIDLLLMPFTAAIMIVPTQSLSRATALLQLQTGKLQEALSNLEEQRQFGQVVSQQVLGLTTELNSTASQQASGSQEQVAVVTQVDSSMIELAATASNIDRLTDQVSVAATQVAGSTQEIEQTTVLSLGQSEEGLQAVNRTVQASQDVTQLYGELLSDLEQLAVKNVDMRTVVGLMTSITEQTHLLSLNASIEAAGAGPYGQRFRVVAQEVKQLADRSAEAHHQIVDIIRELENMAITARNSATKGYTKAEEMARLARQTGEVIYSMREVAEHSRDQAGAIKIAVVEVNELMLVVKIATAQQTSASSTVVQALNGLNVVAAQSAEGSRQIAATALNLEDLSDQLRLALAN